MRNKGCNKRWEDNPVRVGVRDTHFEAEGSSYWTVGRYPQAGGGRPLRSEIGLSLRIESEVDLLRGVHYFGP